MCRFRLLITAVSVIFILTGCEKGNSNSQILTSVPNETQTTDNSEEKNINSSEAQDFLDALTPDELAKGISRLANMYDFEDVNEQVIHSVINTSDGFGNEVLKSYPQLEGLEYIIVFGDNKLIEQVFVYRPEHDKSEVGCHGEYQNIVELGVSDWDELSDLYSNGIPEIKYEPQTKEFSIEEFTDDYDKGVMPKVILTGNDKAIENFSMCCLDRTYDLNTSMVGYIGRAYRFGTKGNIDKVELTFTYVPELLFYDDFSDDKFLPTIYYYDEEKHDLIEIDDQSRKENSVTAELDSLGTYILANKIELDNFWN